MADIWRTRFGGRGHKANGGQGLEAGPKRTQGSQGGRMAETRRSRRTNCGHMADKRRGRAQSTSRPAFFLLRANPTVNCLGNNKRRTSDGQGLEARPKPTTQGGQVTSGGHKRTSGGQAPETRPEHIAASLFFLRENPTVNCWGNNKLL